MVTVALPRQRQAQGQAQAQAAVSGAQVSVLDPDFLMMAMLAFLLDVIPFILGGLDLGIVGAIVSFLFGGIIVVWRFIRAKRSAQAQELVSSMRSRLPGGKKHRPGQITKRIVRKTLRRGILGYILEIIPVINFAPINLILVFSMLKASPQGSSPVRRRTRR